MDLRWSALLAGLLTCVFSAEAAQSLSCRVRAGEVAGTAKPPRATGFVWSAAHGAEEVTGSVRTSLGQIDQGRGSGPTTILTLDGKPLSLPASLAGSVRFGRVIDYGGKVALAYLVERVEDSSASPSQVIVLLGTNGVVLEADVLPGTAAAPGAHCVLVE